MSVLPRSARHLSGPTVSKRINPGMWLQTGIALAVLSLASLAMVSGVGFAQSQVPPANTALPTLLGKAKLGATIAASSGDWQATSPLVFTYQWQLCDAAGKNCVDDAGAGATTRTLGAEAVGHTVRVVVTATNAAGSGRGTAASKVSAVVVTIPDNAPRNTTPPTLRGDARLGQRLRVDNGAWNGASRMSFTHEWQRCDTTGGSCLPVAKATGARYRLTEADADKTIRVVVTAANAVGTNTAVSKQTIAVTGANAPTNTREPRITGSPVVGSTLAATEGAWSGSPKSFAYQWTRCPSSGGAANASNCATIGGAATSKYVAGKGDVGKTLRVRVTAKNAQGSTTAASNATAVVKAASTSAAPANTREPRITGSPVVGSTLAATEGAWSGSPKSFAYQWTRCPSSGGAANASNCATIGGAATSKYVAGKGDVGKTLRVRVTAKNAQGSTTAASNATAVVRGAAQPVANGCAKTGGAIPVAGVSSPARLTIDQTQVSSGPLSFGTRSVTARFHVSACGGPVQGAIVYATAVPYNQFTIPNEQATGSDGWATLRFTALSGYPVSNKQQLLVMFVRARKNGENLLGGISTRRLVSFHVTPRRVTAVNGRGSTTAASNATAVVRGAAQPVANGCAKTGGAIPVAGVSSPARLTIDQTQVSSGPLSFGTRSVTARFHVSACGGPVQGAIVYATAVPYNQFTIPNEQATGSDGWATLRFTALSGYPVSNKQQLLVMFVRARKNGENLLGGISTRRLVSFHVTRG